MRRLLEHLNSDELREGWKGGGGKAALQTPVNELLLASRKQAETITGYRVGTIGH